MMNFCPVFPFLVAFVASTEGNLRVKNFKFKEDHKSDNRDIPQTLSASTVAKCAYQCTANKDCEDANFDKESKTCQLLRKRPKSVRLSLVEQPGLLYIGDVLEIKHEERTRIEDKSSCKAIYDSGKSTGSKAYNLTFNVSTGWSMTYCMMDPITGCGGGGWTMIMKVDGAKKLFTHKSPLWTNKEAYNELAGQTGTEDLTETKMPTFWKTPFTKICLGMRSQSGSLNWMRIDKTADSLFSLLADGTEKNTTLGKPAWEALFPGHVLQQYACKEGFNVDYGTYAKARIGLIADNPNTCEEPNSYIGMGAQAGSYSVSCGSSKDSYLYVAFVSSNCFIFVQ